MLFLKQILNHNNAMLMRNLGFAVLAVLMVCQPVYAVPQPDNGVQREYHPNGQLRLESVFKDERVVRTRSFYANGRMQSEFRYKNGALQRARTFYENGHLRSEWSRAKGIMTFYSPSGTLTQQSQLKEYAI